MVCGLWRAAFTGQLLRNRCLDDTHPRMRVCNATGAPRSRHEHQLRSPPSLSSLLQTFLHLCCYRPARWNHRYHIIRYTASVSQPLLVVLPAAIVLPSVVIVVTVATTTHHRVATTSTTTGTTLPRYRLPLLMLLSSFPDLLLSFSLSFASSVIVSFSDILRFSYSHSQPLSTLAFFFLVITRAKKDITRRESTLYSY